MQEDWLYYFHTAMNVLVTVGVFVMIYLITAKLMGNIGSLPQYNNHITASAPFTAIAIH